MSEIVKCEVTEDVAVITLNDPDKLNALSLKMISELHSYIKLIANKELKARCLVITGSGRGFCAGANLLEGVGKSSFEDVNPGEALEEDDHPFLNDLKNLVAQNFLNLSKFPYSSFLQYLYKSFQNIDPMYLYWKLNF